MNSWKNWLYLSKKAGKVLCKSNGYIIAVIIFLYIFLPLLSKFSIFFPFFLQAIIIIIIQERIREKGEEKMMVLVLEISLLMVGNKQRNKLINSYWIVEDGTDWQNERVETHTIAFFFVHFEMKLEVQSTRLKHLKREFENYSICIM